MASPQTLANWMLQSLFLFILAGLFELSGGYLVWLAIRDGKSFWLAIAGVLILGIYGAVPTLQPTHFSRAYAAYGGIFIVLSLLWGWVIDQIKPDKFDWLGGLIIVVGVMVMMYFPRP